MDKFLCKSCNFVARRRCLQSKQVRKHEAYFCTLIVFETQFNNEIVQLFFKRPYGNNFTNESKVADITGIDILITITFPPKSILLEIAFSPLSLQILTAYSVKIDIPVIFNKREINSVFVF